MATSLPGGGERVVVSCAPPEHATKISVRNDPMSISKPRRERADLRVMIVVLKALHLEVI